MGFRVYKTFSLLPALSPRHPGLFAARWQTRLHRALTAGHVDLVERIAADDPRARCTCMLLDAFRLDGEDADARAEPMLEELWLLGYDPARDPYLTTYARSSVGLVSFGMDVVVTMPVCRTFIGLALAELRENHDDLAGALAVIGAVDCYPLDLIHLSELCLERGRWDVAVTLTDGCVASDEVSSLLMCQRAIALREDLRFAAALACFDDALAVPDLPDGLRRHILAERALCEDLLGPLGAPGRPGSGRRAIRDTGAAAVPGARSVIGNVTLRGDV